MNFRSLALAYSLGAVTALAAPVFSFLWLFASLPPTPLPDWRPSYERLVAAGDKPSADYVLGMAVAAGDPTAFRMLATEIEKGAIPEAAIPDVPQRLRDSARAFAKNEAREREETRFLRRVDRARWHLEQQSRYGLVFALRDTLLWQRCENRFYTLMLDGDRLRRALDEADGRPHRLSRRERALERCAHAMLAHARALEAGRYGKPAQDLAAMWFASAAAAAITPTHPATWAYALRLLDGRITMSEAKDFPAPLAATYVESTRSHAAETLLDAAWGGEREAQLAAAELLLDGRLSDIALRTKHGPAGEAYALLKLAEGAGADVGDALLAAKVRLSPEAIEALDAEILAFGEARSRAGGVSER